LATLFSSTQTTASSFELLQSGLIDALLSFATSGSVNDRARRRRLLLLAFAPCKQEKPVSFTSPLSVLVKKLQESLTRMESFEVIAVAPGLEGILSMFKHPMLSLIIKSRISKKLSLITSPTNPTSSRCGRWNRDAKKLQ